MSRNKFIALTIITALYKPELDVNKETIDVLCDLLKTLLKNKER